MREAGPSYEVNPLDCLQDYLATLLPGPVSDGAALAGLLAACWHEFVGGGEGGMEAYKLRGRIEDVAWSPPKLSFTIARHGGTMLGSTRAELQRWVVDVHGKTATCRTGGHRQLHPMQPPLKVEPIADEIARLIVNGQRDDRLKWGDDGRVRVLIGNVLPAGGATPNQTLTGRRKRLARALEERLNAKGWFKVPAAASHTYSRQSG